MLFFSIQICICYLRRKDMGVNEYERLSNITRNLIWVAFVPAPRYRISLYSAQALQLMYEFEM